MLDHKTIKEDFPIFKKRPGFVYLDSTATALKPQCVIDALTDYYSRYSANIFRGVYDISEEATAAYEETRVSVKDFIGAATEKEIVFTRNATESINVFAHGVQELLSPGDEIITTIFEHHSNFVPWQQLALKKKATFTVLTDTSVTCIASKINTHTKIFAITAVSNVLGTAHPIAEIIQMVKKINPHCLILVDGAQAAPHLKVNVQSLGCDAYVFSSHKMLGPTGVGVLWVKRELLETLPPYQYGGEMIRSVTREKTEFADIPHRFEAGTPHIAGVIALKSAIHYLNTIGLDAIHHHEVELAQLCYDELNQECGKKIQLIGPQKRESGIVAFEVKGVHAHDVAQLLNEDTIAVRAGHHCAMPLHTHLGIEASVRASFYLYNGADDIHKLVSSLQKAIHIFK